MIPAPTTAWICGWAHEPGAFAAETGTKTSSVTRAQATAWRRPISLPIGSRVGRFKRPIAARARRPRISVPPLGNPAQRCQTRRMLRAGVVCARVALPALLAFVVMTGAERLAGTSPIQSRLQPTSVLWANRIFATRADLARWLRSKGASYETWALSHPRLAAANSPQRTEAADQRASAVHSKGQDPTHLIALGVAGGVALLLALVLLYERRTYDFRGRLQRATPAPAPSGGRPRTALDVSTARTI